MLEKLRKVYIFFNLCVILCLQVMNFFEKPVLRQTFLGFSWEKKEDLNSLRRALEPVFSSQCHFAACFTSEKVLTNSFGFIELSNLSIKDSGRSVSHSLDSIIIFSRLFSSFVETQGAYFIILLWKWVGPSIMWKNSLWVNQSISFDYRFNL